MKHFNQVSKKMSVFLAFLLIGVTTAFAQLTVKGTVTDEAGDPIIGASILEKGTTNGTITDFDGKFSLKVPKGTVVDFLNIGVATVSIQVKSDMTDQKIIMKQE